MKKILVTLLYVLVTLVTYSQTGVGYLNYTVYNLSSYINGRNSYANNATDFVNMFDTTKGTTVYKRGTTTAQNALYYANGFGPGSPGSYNGIKSYGYFIPKETGVYSFGIDGDDGVDLSVDGTVITSFYGAHGYGGYRYGTVSLVAGKSYTFMVRMQNVGGGWGVYAVWKRPSQSTWSVQSNEVSSAPPDEPTKKALANFDFGSTLDKTKFLASTLALNSSGQVDITNALDSNKIATGYKATIGINQWESVIINPYESSISGHRLLLDERMFNSSSPSFNSINSIKVLDIYDGPVTVYDTSGWWKTYIIPGDIASKITASTYQSSLRLQDGWYAIQTGTNITYAPTTTYKPQSIAITTTNTLATLYNSIVTVSDVYIAFKELANGGIFGDQTGNEFVYGIQYKNADVNDDGYFNESDCFALLQHLTGIKNLVDTIKLSNILRLMPKSTYNTITKSNWNTFSSYLGDSVSFSINTGKAIDTLNLAGTWKGDINLSHSATPVVSANVSNSIRAFSTSMPNEINASILTEVVGDSIYAYITLDPLSQNVVGAQFQLNYDNSVLKFRGVRFTTKGSPTNFATDKGAYINIGSLISDGSTSLDNTTTYKLSFSSSSKLDNMLGLISIGTTDAVNKTGASLKIKMN